MRLTLETVLAALLGAVLAVNGVVMLAYPLAWYGAVPGVPGTGPFNPHFVRDIGCAYLAGGAALLWFSARREARPAVAVAALFLGLHALVHLWDMAAGREPWSHLLADLPTIFLPPALAAWLARPMSAEE